jgi:hypothetical protein
MTVMFVGHVVSTGELKDVYTILIRKPVGKKPVRRPGSRYEEITVKNST